ncbi:MAG: hypothetical protein QF614_08060 [SAR324 cluster bacterium]|nr:hypothetical protein [SAR324 cluster bacterium]
MTGRGVSGVLLAVLLLFGCAPKVDEVFYKEGNLSEFQAKAVQRCHGDFDVLATQRFGKYERAQLICKPGR